MRSVSGLPNESGTHISAILPGSSRSAPVRTGGRRRRRSLRLIVATSPPRTIRAIRRQACLNQAGVNAGPRERPFSSMGEYGLLTLFISDSGRR